MKKEITASQKKVLDFIADYTSSENVPPTVREIARHFGFASPGTVQDYLGALKSKGYISVKKNFYRGIELLSPARGIPLLGRVRAGNPQEAIENVEKYIDVSRLFPTKNGTFALKVEGDSMSGSGIFEGDLAIVTKQQQAEDNDIVVALFPRGQTAADVGEFPQDHMVGRSAVVRLLLVK